MVYDDRAATDAVNSVNGVMDVREHLLATAFLGLVTKCIPIMDVNSALAALDRTQHIIQGHIQGAQRTRPPPPSED